MRNHEQWTQDSLVWDLQSYRIFSWQSCIAHMKIVLSSWTCSWMDKNLESTIYKSIALACWSCPGDRVNVEAFLVLLSWWTAGLSDNMFQGWLGELCQWWWYRKRLTVFEMSRKVFQWWTDENEILSLISVEYRLLCLLHGQRYTVPPSCQLIMSTSCR